MPTRHFRIARYFIRIAAIEDRIRLLTSKYKIDEDDIKRLLNIDPTGGSYLEWLVQRWDRGELTGYDREQNYKIRELLTTFTKVKKSPQLLQGNSSDINKYTVEKLTNLIGQIVESGDLMSNRERNKGFKSSGSRLVYDDGNFKIIQIGGEGVDLDKAAHAACLYAYGSKWCTSNAGTAKNYLKEDPLYVIFRDGQKAAQYSPRQSGEIQDLLSDSLSPYKKENRDIFEAIGKSGIPIPEGLLDDYIGARIPLSESAMQRIIQSPRLSYIYARDHIKGRWVEQEHVIAQNPRFGVMYAENMLKKRWAELEQNLIHLASTSFPYTWLTDPIKDYTRAFFPRGWPEMVAAWEKNV